MFTLKSARVALLAGAACFTFAMSANAADAATRGTCTKTASALQDALNANGQSPNYEEAVKERRAGFEFCQAGMYQKGVDHYSQAMKLLQPLKADNNGNPDNS